MKILPPLLLPVALLLAGCATSAPVKPSSDHPSLVGTWRWVRLDDHAVPQRFHVRYYADGTAATWPAPADWSTTVNGVSRGRYHLEGESLVLETGRGKNDPKTHLEVKGNELILVTDESHRLIYRRVVPDLEPGK